MTKTRSVLGLSLSLLVTFASDGAAARSPLPRPPSTCPVAYVEPGPSKARCMAETLVDEFDDGTIDYRVLETYNRNGDVNRRHTDLGNDGTYDEKEYRYYDASGRLLSVEYDLDVDGTADLIMANTYDANGDLVHSETTYNGTVLSELDVTPGPCGPVAVESYGIGGVLLQTGVYNWTSTSMVLELTQAGSTSVGTRITQRFDAATGRTESFEHDDLAMPGVEEWFDHHYDPITGLLTSTTMDGPSETLYFYEVNQRLVEKLEGNGLLVRSTIQWTCP